ncbi:hypothetical protein BDR05DRAFT_944597 [Suillus weaverae]|nr:hypothetical protein BDR05DRAFT_944597 [Suillus weaverae]
MSQEAAKLSVTWSHPKGHKAIVVTLQYWDLMQLSEVIFCTCFKKLEISEVQWSSICQLITVCLIILIVKVLVFKLNWCLLCSTFYSTHAPPSPYTANLANGLRQPMQHMLLPTPNSLPPSQHHLPTAHQNQNQTLKKLPLWFPKPIRTHHDRKFGQELLEHAEGWGNECSMVAIETEGVCCAICDMTFQMVHACIVHLLPLQHRQTSSAVHSQPAKALNYYMHAGQEFCHQSEPLAPKLVKAVLCHPSVLNRLNSLCEPSGVLVLILEPGGMQWLLMLKAQALICKSCCVAADPTGTEDYSEMILGIRQWGALASSNVGEQTCQSTEMSFSPSTSQLQTLERPLKMFLWTIIYTRYDSILDLQKLLNVLFQIVFPLNKTLWGCCGASIKGTGDMGPHMTDTKHLCFHTDSAIHDDKLVSCAVTGCYSCECKWSAKPLSPHSADSAFTTTISSSTTKVARYTDPKYLPTLPHQGQWLALGANNMHCIPPTDPGCVPLSHHFLCHVPLTMVEAITVNSTVFQDEEKDTKEHVFMGSKTEAALLNFVK